MKELLNEVRRVAEEVNGRRVLVKSALVDSYSPDYYAAKVRIQPEDRLTGWLPVYTPWAGDGWGLFAPPSAGDQVTVHHLEGDPDNGYVGLRAFSDADRPLPVPSGEFWLVHKAGGFIKLHNDGSVEINAPGNLTATAPTATFNANVQINGTLGVTKAISGQSTISATGTINSSGGDIQDKTGTMAAMRSTYDGHTHGGVTTGGGNTATPSASM